MSDDRGSLPVSPDNTGLSVREALVLKAQLTALIVVVSILSVGLIACSIFFIWMCFLHPGAAETLLPLLIPAGMGALVLRYGKRAIEILKDNNE